jgi:hypothetical protein
MDIETLTYDDFIPKWLSACIKILPKTNHRIREYLIQYQTFCSKLLNNKKMNEELLKQTESLFDSPQKWSAFIELMDRSGEMQNRWLKRLQQEVSQREKKDLDSNWNIYVGDNCEIRWHIKGEANNTFIIHFWGKESCLGVHNDGALDADKVEDLIQESRFDIIKDGFDRIGEWDKSNNTMEEHGNFKFDSIHNGRFTDKILVWYAGNKTKEFADQLIRKVRKLQTPEIKELFKEINAKCKKDN